MSKGRVFKDGDACLFEMPALQDERVCSGKKNAHRSVEEIEREAYEEGFASGEKAGFASGEQKALVIADRLEQVLREIIAFRDSLVNSSEEQVVELAMAMARRVIHEEIAARPAVIITMVTEAIKRLHRSGRISIKINPALYDIFAAKKQDLIDIHEDIVFDVSADVPVTGPLVISQTQEVVTDVDSLLDNLMEEMVRGVENS